MKEETEEMTLAVCDLSDMVLVNLESAANSLPEGENQQENQQNAADGDETFSSDQTGTRLQRREQPEGQRSNLPDVFQTCNLLFYERFKVYQDYMLGDCKPSEVKTFIADYLEKVLEPSDWLALWCTQVFDVLVEVQDLELKDLKACVKPILPLRCDARGCDLTEESMNSLLEATEHKVLLQELQPVYDESGDVDETAVALEHLRFFYKHIWRQWDEEDEDDDFDYFVRCVEPRLRFHYDVLEDRVPAGLVAEHRSLLENCSQCFRSFTELRNEMSGDSDSELDNVSMVEGLKLCEQMEKLKRKLHLIENPLLRYVLAYRGPCRQHAAQSRGRRPSGIKMIHVVTESCRASMLQSLFDTRLTALCSSEDSEIQTDHSSSQFHRDPVSAVEACYQDDTVIVLPGTYKVSRSISIPDSITMEGFGFPDDVVLEEANRGESFLETTAPTVHLCNLKFIQHGSTEGIVCVRGGTLTLEECVLQCDTTGVMIRTTGKLTMSMCDLYGSKGPGVEVYPGSVCNLLNNNIHHCKDGILIKDFANDQGGMPAISMVNNIIHNNNSFGVILVTPESIAAGSQTERDNMAAADGTEDMAAADGSENMAATARTENMAAGDGSGNMAAAGPANMAAGRKWPLSRDLSRSRESSCSRAVQDLMKHQIFVSVLGNQYKRNGRGDFGTFSF